MSIAEFFSFSNSNFVVALSLFGFLGLLAWFGVHRLLGAKLDARAEGIRGELDEARRLREEAQEVFASFERKQREVEEQASEIVARAEREAKDAAERAKEEIAASVELRIKRARDQIESAESAAMTEIRERAVRVAVAAAGEVLQKSLSAEKSESLIDSSIDETVRRLA